MERVLGFEGAMVNLVFYFVKVNSCTRLPTIRLGDLRKGAMGATRLDGRKGPFIVDFFTA